MIRRFFSYYKPHKRLFFIDFSSAIVVAVLELAFPLVVQWFIDTLIPGGDWLEIVWVSIGLLLIYLLSTGLQYIVNYLGHKLGINIETDMRQELFQHVQRQSFRYFDNTKTGHIISRITNDLFDIGELAHHGPEDLFIAVMTFLGAFWIMLTINVKLALVAVLFVPLLIILIIYSNIRMNRAWRQMYSEIADVNARVEDSVSGVRVVQSFTNERFEISRFLKNNQKFRKAKLKGYKTMALTTAGTFLMTRLMILAVLVFGAWLSFSGNMSYGEFVGFVLYVNVLFKPIDKISAILELYPKGMAGFKRFTELIDTKPQIVDRKDAIDVPALEGNIVFKNVTFGYEKHKPVLRGIDLSIKAGETVAFVGPSGAGKTTISSLIPRFYDIDGGAITIDGIDIRDMTKRSLRSQIGIVQQDVFLFTGTLRENIAYGKLDATDEEIQRAAKMAHLEQLIESLPDGYETQVGERGLKLSGGQKQRIAIARMFLKNPPILILDEATSALDTETEQVIQNALTELAKDRTTLVIAHRLATIRNADRIVVVTENGIAEEGTHDELVERGGIFANLHRVQYQS
ncbi:MULTISPECIES: ABC transporter ATP-binding protein [Bacillus]|jgi:ATP-binding cassette subfamily B protein|uniref:Glycoside hydrolase, family 1,ABC transporter n=1 Tax=Bacillus licheniformis (strain ATCC 14580 / DSM 13 / JCM 2505 / CCUG 7422 / NBRC 12200 / NCIMB 9375 / NCTC 10341 / NRRL NRS-1264 / Gibson 46) TaxID=279010 RepID=Q62NX2_BACLD|nr:MULTISPECIES: ABC transporter ATP-binding protein [Bacillus]MDP4135476.1 ABC transporter ATP-binding protein [Bacillota bacterium]AAU25539.1 Glycoside hydrolase, family 1,ABC transporter [Bacillus licheniformis DSM 13 = ATCC 14580]ARC60925.1 putative multidrug export ATP-binding/permease protein [Bacillus licheniformis]AUZ32620.1 ABC transporter ATP-binding protein [Bacillus licheniformis]AYC53797.1 ABC transporter ATP-binding protein [Bacillus licheniformis]